MVPKREDVENAGVSQPGEPGEDTTQIVVSEEHIVMCLKQTVETRRCWLKDMELPENTVMNDEQRQQFLSWVEAEFVREPLQMDLCAKDLQRGRAYARQQARQRWRQEIQRRCGRPLFVYCFSC